MFVRYWPCLLIGASFLVGCGSKPAEVPTAEAPTEAPAPVETPAVAESAPTPEPPSPPEPEKTLVPAAAKVEPPAIPDSPAELVKLVARELSENRPQILFYSLPASYQNDLFLMIAKPASVADPEIWSNAVEAFRNVGVAMKVKKEVLVNYPAIHVFGVTKEQVERYWDPVVDLVDLVANSNINNTANLESINLGDYLAETGGQIMQKSAPVIGALINANINEELKNVEATVVSQEGDTAVVKIDIPGGDSQEVEFLRVEGKWVPQYVAQNWPYFLDNAKKVTDMLMPKKTDDKRKRQAQMLPVTVLKSFAESVPQTDDADNIYRSLDFIFRFAKFDIPERKTEKDSEDDSDEGIRDPGAAPATPPESSP